jgi:hypothetical protein
MATIINNPDSSREGSSGVITAILVILGLILLFVFGVPALRNMNAGGGTNINVPDTINVNTNPGAGAQ